MECVGLIKSKRAVYISLVFLVRKRANMVLTCLMRLKRKLQETTKSDQSYPWPTIVDALSNQLLQLPAFFCKVVKVASPCNISNCY